MKIGIVTVYDSANFGSFLQAYALMRYLQAKGHEVSFIKWNKKNQISHDILKRAVLTRRVSLKNICSAIDKIKYYKQDIQVLPITEQMLGMDLVIIGSDTLWDIRRNYFANPMFYGEIGTDIPCISYAVSCAESQIEDFQSKNLLADNIKKIDKVMVRDKHTQDMIHKFLNITSELVCDPTILIGNKFWNTDTKIDEEYYILVYTYSMPKQIVKYIKQYARERKLKLISIGLYQPWCDSHINCSALEFPVYLQKAELVVTNTFHGTIFSILTKSNIISVKNGNKLKELIESLNAEQILIDTTCSYQDFCKKANQDILYAGIYSKMQDMRKKSDKLLENAIKIYGNGDNE